MTLQHRLFENWLDSDRRTLAERWWWFAYRVVRGWGSLRGVNRDCTPISDLRPISADTEPCCDGRLGDDCRCDCHVGLKPSDSQATHE